MYMAQIRLTSTRREVRIKGPSGVLMGRFDIGDGDDYEAVLSRHGLRSFGRRYELDAGDGEAFMIRVDPVYEEVYTGRFGIELDHFHRQVVVWIQDKKVRFLDEQEAQEAAKALTRAAADAREWWG